jgi:inositol-phosphate transport system permease protein
MMPPARAAAGYDVETINRRRLNLVLALALGLASAPMLFLYLLLVLSSFADTMLTGPDIFQAEYSLRNWRMLFEGQLSPEAGRIYTTRDIVMIIANTLVVALGVTAVVVLVSVMAGYAFSRLRFRWRRGLMESIILLHAFPGVALIIAVYAVYVWSLGFVPRSPGARAAYAMLYTVLARASLEIPMSIWLMKGFFDRIPWEIEWSALVDGASRLTVWRRIMLPLVKPGIAALAIFAFLAGWEDLIYVRVFLYPDIKTLATFIEETVAGIETSYLPVVAAAGTLYLLPTILFFVATQRLLLEAMSGGVKG